MTRKRYIKLMRALITDYIILNNVSNDPKSNKKMYSELNNIHPPKGVSYSESWKSIEPLAEIIHKEAEPYIAINTINKWIPLLCKEIK